MEDDQVTKHTQGVDYMPKVRGTWSSLGHESHPARGMRLTSNIELAVDKESQREKVMGIDRLSWILGRKKGRSGTAFRGVLKNGDFNWSTRFLFYYLDQDLMSPLVSNLAGITHTKLASPALVMK